MHSHLVFLNLLSLAFAAPSTRRSEPAPLFTTEGEVIANQYIVKYKDTFSISSADSVLRAFNAEADRVYSHVFNGFAGTLSETAVTQLRNHPDVDYIEQNAKVKINGFVEQQNVPWGLARISHRKAGNTSYVYDDSAGTGTCAYVIDTGIDDTHPEFEGRAKLIKSFVDGENNDGHGHGTHVSGTIGSRTYGVAKKTSIFGVKVLDNQGSGTWDNVIAGMDFVIQDAKTRACPKGALANMSLGGARAVAVNEAAAKMIQAGVFLGVAAGNEGRDASKSSPASEPTVCTVGSTEETDDLSYFSNRGTLVDVLAPGSEILSTTPGNKTETMSGTSMASPHIVGLAAYLAGLEGFPGAQALCERIRALATKDAVKKLPAGTVNLLAFNGNPSG